MAPGYRLNKPKHEEDIDRLFYGDHKITIFDNPDYEQARNGYLKLQESFNNGSENSRNRCNCHQYEKIISFYQIALMILLFTFILRFVIDGIVSIVNRQK